MPEGPWEFDKGVTEVFEDMLERSIPDYKKMRTASSALAFASGPVDRVLDIGCSNGLALRRLDKYAETEGHKIHRLVGLDVSEPMLEKAEEECPDNNRYYFLNHDLREHFPFPHESFDVVLSVLTLQFVPLIHRLWIMDEVHRILTPGGRLIFVEKVLGNGPLDENMVEVYHDHKRDMGYTEEQIERKKLSLEGVMVPITSSWNEELLDKAGFAVRDCFWRWMNFSGWVAIK